MGFTIFFVIFNSIFFVSNAMMHINEGVIILNENIQAIPTTFSKTLDELKIVNTTLTSLENLSHYKNLKSLVIENTQIEFLNETFFEIEKIRKLDSLALIESTIQFFDLNKLKKLRSLKYLNLSGNQGITFHGSGRWSGVTYLNVARSGLKELPGGFENLRHLEKLVIDGNLIETLPEYLCKLRKLKFISAKQNHLRRIPKELEGMVLSDI